MSLPELHAEIRLETLDLCTSLLPLLARWRSRAEGRRLAELYGRLPFVIDELACDPAHPAFTIVRDIRDLLVSARKRCVPGPLRPAIAAADLLLGLWTAWLDGLEIAFANPPPVPGAHYSMTIPTDPGEPSGLVEVTPAQMVELQRVMAAENERQRSGLPPSADCPICAVLGAPHEHGVASA